MNAIHKSNMLLSYFIKYDIQYSCTFTHSSGKIANGAFNSMKTRCIYNNRWQVVQLSIAKLMVWHILFSTVRLTVPLCWHVSAHADICADTFRCRHVPTCVEIYRHSECLRTQSLRPYSGADIWDALACVNTGKCADMCQHVTLISTPLIVII